MNVATQSRKDPALDEFHAIEMLEAEKIVLVTRSDRPFARSTEIIQSFGLLRDHLAKKCPLTYAVLVDLRRSPPPQAPELEQVTSQARKGVFDSFRRKGLILKSAAGNMQMFRLNRENSEHFDIFGDKAAAVVAFRKHR